ncbi:hypothetical protein BOX15_Mlig003393g3 [Macrostomum lignano]|uniref:Uncharacterized protein n=1 Tax=Macrostomum lignano TaxID=282301 RepID=A0A267EE47_9PLAT|nr:hypothetical protein BOX15_Mlig003393g3 [Macrostomum lignano]
MMRNHMKRIGSFLKGESPSEPAGIRRRIRRPSNLAFKVDHSASPTKSILQSLLTLYGLMALMLGVVIPISDALTKPVEHADYRQIFYIFMHGLGIVCIVYLNTLISCHQHHRAADFTPEEAARSKAEFQQPTVSFSPEAIAGTAASTSSGSKFFMPEDRDSVDEQLPDGHFTATTLCARSGCVGDRDGIAADSGQPKVDADAVQIELAGQAADALVYEESGPQRADDVPAALTEPVEFEANDSSRGRRLRRRRRVASHKKLIGNVQKRLSRTWRSPPTMDESWKHPVKKITWSAVGVNLYLRLGAIVFGFGVMVHDGFKIADVLERPGSEVCVGPWFLPKRCIHLLFIMCQTYYVFKHHRVTINTQKALVRFVFVHLIVTNLCIWVKTVVYEIKVGLTPKNSSSDSNGSSNYVAEMLKNGTDGCHGRYLEEDSPSYQLGPYLYPCAVEYGLICAAICYKFFSRVGDLDIVPYGRKEQQQGPRSTTCHKSHKGLFMGLMIMICVLVPMISLILLQMKKQTEYKDVYILAVILTECSVLCFTTGMALAGIVKAIRNLRLYKVRGNETFDVNLLFVGLAGIVCYNLFVAISVGACLMDTKEGEHCNWGDKAEFYNTKANGFKSMLEVAQSVLQTLFIMQAIQRKVTMKLIEGMHKPGRGVTIALLIANLAMWVASVFEAQRNIAENFLLTYFGDMPWKIIKYIFLPLIIFFRFHSTVCLSEIWIQSYKPQKGHQHRHHHDA